MVLNPKRDEHFFVIALRKTAVVALNNVSVVPGSSIAIALLPYPRNLFHVCLSHSSVQMGTDNGGSPAMD